MSLLPPVRAAYGALLASVPDRVIRLCGGRPAQSPDAAVAGAFATAGVVTAFHRGDRPLERSA